MENCSNATSNCSQLAGGLLDGPGFGVFSLLMALLSVALCALTILTIAALCMARTMSKHLRIFLINILAGVLVMGGAFLTFTALSVILVFADSEPPPILFCRFLAWVLGIGGYARPLNVSAYAVVVLVTVRFGKKDWKMLYSGLAIAILWFILLAMNAFVLVPPVAGVQYLEGVACYIDSESSFIEAGIGFVFILVVFGNLTPLAVSVVTPVYCLYYIRRNSISGDTRYKKVISRLALFLITGNTVNLVGNVVQIACGFASYASVSAYLLYGVGVLSLIPTPIFIILMLKVVQDQMKAIITCHCSQHRIYPSRGTVDKIVTFSQS